MDPQHTGDMLNHLEKQNELLKEAHKTMTQELQKLEVEHEMMMRKLYELTNSHCVNKKNMEETQIVSEGREIVEVSSSLSIENVYLCYQRMQEIEEKKHMTPPPEVAVSGGDIQPPASGNGGATRQLSFDDDSSDQTSAAKRMRRL